MNKINDIKEIDIARLLSELNEIGAINIYKVKIENTTEKYFEIDSEKEQELFDDIHKLLSDTQEKYFKMGMLYGELERIGKL